jgi:hypothetical protein
VPELARLALRLLGLALVLISVTCLVLLVWPGPAQVAEAMGSSCAHDRHGSTHQCGWWEAADVLWTGFVVSLVAGLALCLATRPEGRRPLTIDLSRLRRR